MARWRGRYQQVLISGFKGDPSWEEVPEWLRTPQSGPRNVSLLAGQGGYGTENWRDGDGRKGCHGDSGEPGARSGRQPSAGARWALPHPTPSLDPSTKPGHRRPLCPLLGPVGDRASGQIPSQAPGSFLGVSGQGLWLDGGKRASLSWPAEQQEAQGSGRPPCWMPAAPGAEVAGASPGWTRPLTHSRHWSLGT